MKTTPQVTFCVFFLVFFLLCVPSNTYCFFIFIEFCIMVISECTAAVCYSHIQLNVDSSTIVLFQNQFFVWLGIQFRYEEIVRLEII